MLHCSHCDAQYLKWQGRCTECGKWGTIPKEEAYVESTATHSRSQKASKVAPAGVLNLTDAKAESTKAIPTNISELDRVLSGGIVAGSVTLLAGEPGIGKSTLVAQIAHAFKQKNAPAYYVSGEESTGQLLMRFQRLNISPEYISFSNTISIPSVISASKKLKPSLVIIDSIQTMAPDSETLPGTPTAVRGATALCIEYAKSTGTPVLIIGQVTKDGSVAGPKTLEHLVDTVITLEGDRDSSYRILRANKHRFGSTDEIGIFEMTERGMIAVDNPSAKFLEERQHAPGSVITCIMEGTRPILLEVQALAERSIYPNPVRRTSGFDAGRLQMLIAIISKRVGVEVNTQDIYVNVVGGMTVKETALDLAVCCAIISSVKDKAMPDKTVIFGELGLGGEIRSIPHQERRIKEAKRIGYTNVICPKNAKQLKDLFKNRSK